MEQQIITLRMSGLGYGEIARELGIKKELARYYCTKHGMNGTIGKIQEVKPKPVKEKFCHYCGIKHQRQRKYCSDDCARNSAKDKKNANKKISVCIVCGKATNKIKGGKYCSKACHDQWMSENPRHEKSCLFCGKVFRTNLKKQAYCSHSCSSTHVHKTGKVKCSDTLSEREERFAQMVSSKTKGRFTYVCGYKSADDPVTIHCNSCGNDTQRSAQLFRASRHKDIECYTCNAIKRSEEQKQKRIDAKKNRDAQMIANRYLVAITKSFRVKSFVCGHCGVVTYGKSNSKYCSTACMNKQNDYRKSLVRKRRVDANGKVDTIGLPKLFKRDNGMCHICGGACDYNDYHIDNGSFYAHGSYPSVDHVIPIAKGGTHTWDNVMLAHMKCDSVS